MGCLITRGYFSALTRVNKESKNKDKMSFVG